MTTCRQCGAALREGTKFCTECGAPVERAPARTAAPVIEYPTKKPRKKRKKPLLRRWWLWLLILLAAGAVIRGGGFRKTASPPTQNRGSASLSTAAPQATPRPTEAAIEIPAPSAAAKPAEAAAETPAPEETAVSEPPSPADALIRPEVRDMLDAYEATMDEYVAFMQRYGNADASDMAAMMADYADMMARYAEFAEKIDALGESELSDAELAYYMEVTSRVSQKLLRAAG